MIDPAYIDKVLSALPEVEAKLADPASVADRKAYRKLVMEHAALRRVADHAAAYRRLLRERDGHRELMESDEAELAQMAREEIAAIEEKIPAAEQALLASLLPPSETDSRSAVVEIRAGTGGEEAALFAADLFRMYSHFVEGRGWKVRLVDLSSNDIGGYKEAIFTVEGEGAYGALKYESGGHRVQRVPATEAQGRIHTSAATVAVFPEAEPEDDIQIPPNEIRIDIFRSSGPGGQSVNTTDSAVRVTHLPTGLIVQCQDEKSQHRNRERALSVLKARLLEIRRRAEQEKMGQTRRTLTGSGDRSERIRTYNFPQNRFTDHRIGLTVYSLDRIIEGHLDDVLSALRAHDTEMRLQDEIGRAPAANPAPED
ncbi:MAG: peptide chain release factor 1 [Lentisphaerae bacterium]|nr:peptide chain release factor 1 [Lentisphaerota bacterium]